MFTVEYAKNLFWCDAEHTFFECVVKYKEFDGELPVGVNGTDKYQHIQELWVKGNAGEYGAITEYVAPPEPSLPLEDQPTTTGAQTL